MDVSAPPRSLTLPPPYTAHWRPDAAPFDEAQRLAEDEGAGTLVWRQTTGGQGPGRLQFAVVLEPEMPLSEARKAVIIAMVALGDAVAAHAPPERDLRFDWPTGLILDAGRLGRMTLAVAPGTEEEATPDWMVLGVDLIADRDHLDQEGAEPGAVSLKEEEFTDPPAIIESFAAHLMLNFDRWTHDGFAAVAPNYAGRLTEEGAISDAGERVLDATVESLKTGLARSEQRAANGAQW